MTYRIVRLHSLKSRSFLDGRSIISQGEFVPRKFENSFLFGAPPVWVRTALDVIFNNIICLAYRVGTEVRKCSLARLLRFLPKFLRLDC